ncbi:MAG: hypothetical protein MK110_14890 [Fuerstiella sp.]|nr:hypothetical protein [Fuerstiella sp.]
MTTIHIDWQEQTPAVHPAPAVIVCLLSDYFVTLSDRRLARDRRIHSCTGQNQLSIFDWICDRLSLNGGDM